MVKMTTKLKAIAYRRGVNAGKQRRGQGLRRMPNCPYDYVKKRDMHDWFWEGYNDYADRKVNDTMYEAGKGQEDDRY